jgi:heme exporter protein A
MPMDSAVPAIEVLGLKKAFGHQYALRGLDLVVQPGEFVTIFGPNGAGKTTLIRILSHLIRPTSGTVRVLGVPVDQAEGEIRRQIGVISHQTFLYPQLTGRENLTFYGRLFDLEDLPVRIDEVLSQVELSDRADSLVRTWSKGMGQRLAIARAILHRPQIVLLDEPYTGLDQHAAALLSRLLRQLRDGRRTLIMTTHNLEQGLELSHRICIQAAGKMVYDAPRADLTPASLGKLYFERLEAAIRPTGRLGGHG